MDVKTDISSVTDRLSMLCSIREYCVSDVFSKALKALEGDREGAQKVVESLVRDRYVDDYRYSCAYVRDKSAISGWGVSKIRYMLSAKGVSRDVIDKALLEMDADKAEARMDRLLRLKSRSLKGDAQIRVKLLRYAVGRGYPYEEASGAINEILKEDEYNGI